MRNIEIFFAIALLLVGVGFSVSGIQNMPLAVFFWVSGIAVFAYGFRDSIRKLCNSIRSDSGYETFVWKGQTRYRCPYCVYDNYDKVVVEGHVKLCAQKAKIVDQKG